MKTWENILFLVVIRPAYYICKFFQKPLRKIINLFTGERIHNEGTRADADAFAKAMWVRLHEEHETEDGWYFYIIQIGSSTGRQIHPAFYEDFSIPSITNPQITSYDFGKSLIVSGPSKHIPECIYVFYRGEEYLMTKLIPDPTAITNVPRQFPTAEELFPD